MAVMQGVPPDLLALAYVACTAAVLQAQHAHTASALGGCRVGGSAGEGG